MTDPAIKLFGKTIPLRVNEDFQLASAAANDLLLETSSSTSSSSLASSSSSHEEQSQKAQQLPEKKEEDKDGSDQSPDDEEAQKKELAGPVGDCESMEADPSAANGSNLETATENDSKTHKEQKGASNLKDQKTVKKPDKILPCPRCNSLDTKFCYYNNYNVNQPRHFCKNCQRYWTAGGTMRNVPVGAGRRKNKNSSSSHYRHMSLSEALQTARNEMPEAIFHPQIPLKPNGTVLSFGSDSPLCESMASVLSLTETAMRNGFHRAEEERSLENGEEHSSGSSVTASNSGEEEPLARNCQEFAPPPPPPPPPLPCFPAAPWTYPWNSAPWTPAPVAPPGFCASSFPMPFYPAPAAYWGCAIPGAWTIPWVSPPSASPTAPNGSAPTPISPTLGKHAREGDILKQKEDSEKEEEAVLKERKTSSERCLWIPKTLRIDDPGEAARSSIWATLGIQKGDGISGGGLFKSFQPKADEQSNCNRHNSQVLHANPAALSRSLNFQESS